MDAHLLSSVFFSTGRPHQPVSGTLLLPPGFSSMQFSPGRGRIAAKVEIKSTPVNMPVARRVVLLRHVDDKKVAETWSDALGNYSFADIDERQTYYVIAFDHTGSYRAVIADKLRPEVD